MEDKPLVSIVIPTYNRPSFLTRCIDSVRNQTYDKVEVIVVDDNNPNTEARKETEKIMYNYASDEKVTYLQHEKNKNGSAARNTGWRQAQGKYITFLDDDDEIAPAKIERQVACLEKLDRSWGACYTSYKIIKEHGANQFSTEKRSGNCYIDALMRTLFMGSGSNLLLRKEVVDKINGYDESFQRNQDIEFMVRVLEQYKLAYVDEMLLTIYQEGFRPQMTFEQMDGYALHYLKKMDDRIKKLNPKDQKRVIAVISLERFRIALYKKKIISGVKILISNKVSIVYIVKYAKYIINRKITNASYGFNGK